MVYDTALRQVNRPIGVQTQATIGATSALTSTSGISRVRLQLGM